MKRNLLCLATVLLLVSVDLIQAQQPPRIARIGLLASSSSKRIGTYVDAFRQGLRALGYVEGQNAVIEYRSAEGKIDRLSKLADELVRLNVDVIFAQAAPAIRAAKHATKTIPIVFEMLADPVSAGFVASLAKPGGNLTGIGGLASQLTGKRLELLKEIVPRLTLVAVLANPANPHIVHMLRDTETAASALNLQLQVLEIKDAAKVDEALSSVIKARAEAMSVFPDPMLSSELKKLVSFANRNRLPAVYGTSFAVENGAFMAYAPSQSEMYRRAAYYVDRILKGSRPDDLPVEQPTRFELQFNLHAARQIGLTIPPNVLARADKVIR
jgi:putative tryptophan/tyrosine transport system substrate-binding protein